MRALQKVDSKVNKSKYENSAHLFVYLRYLVGELGDFPLSGHFPAFLEKWTTILYRLYLRPWLMDSGIQVFFSFITLLGSLLNVAIHKRTNFSFSRVFALILYFIVDSNQRAPHFSQSTNHWPF